MIHVIAGATFREAVRARAFLGLLGFYAAAVALSPVIGWISGTDGHIITTDLVMALQSLAGVLVAIATASVLVHTEIQQKTLYTVLSRPLPRWWFVVGKFLGLAGALLAGQALMLAFGLGYLWITGSPVGWGLVAAGILTMAEVLIMAAVSLCLTALAGPLLSATLSIAVYALGHAVGTLPQLMHHLHTGFQTWLCVVLASLVPDLSRFTFRDLAPHGIALPFGDFAVDLVYAALWVALLVAIAVAVVRRRQL
jgi:ABC-type transport system involved in multi-copper enzyme maturation permease subunit